MATNLVIVESPNKIKTISKFLGPAYVVKASMGHCYQIDPESMSIDIEDNYKPKYKIAKGKAKVVKELQDAARKSKTIYIATDPDREGEAIGWQLANFALKKYCSDIQRVFFHEITKSAVTAAFKKPVTLNDDLYHAQQARSVLDRLVGYGVSPVLWRKVCKGTSAGRVQSIGLQLIVQRQKEIDAFIPEEYWTIDGIFDTTRNEEFVASYKQPKKITNDKDAKNAVDSIRAEKSWKIVSVDKSEKKRHPSPLFTTSTLQQFASSYFGWSGKKTMEMAQKLYEGFAVGGQSQAGLITYHRTDSTVISKEAISDVRNFIEINIGKSYLPPKPNFYKTKSKSAQEAHEGIRPTHLEHSLSDVQRSIPADAFKLYEAIYRKFVSCQMSDTIYDNTKILVQSGKHEFVANGSVIKFDGFLKMWTYSSSSDKNLPVINEKESTDLKDLKSQQHFTKPPAAYNDGSLVKSLEEKGVGRPSTYASVLDTLLKRTYVIKEGKVFRPTELGTLVSDYLIQAFPEMMDTAYTARIEEQLDDVAEGNKIWHQTVDGFYVELDKRIKGARADNSVKKTEDTDIVCPSCGKSKLVIRRSKYGKFYGCSAYILKGKDKCKATFKIGDDGEPIEKEPPKYLTGVACDKCGSKVIIRTSKKTGKEFGGCSGFPKCKRMFDLEGNPIEFKTYRRGKK